MVRIFQEGGRHGLAVAYLHLLDHELFVKSTLLDLEVLLGCLLYCIIVRSHLQI